MYQLDLKEVKYPHNFAEKVKKDQEKNRRFFITQGKTEEEALKLVPKEDFNQVQDVELSISAALSNFFQLKHFDKEKDTIVAPFDLRKKASKINMKVSENEDGKLELSDEQMDFLIEVLKIDQPRADQFIYLVDYLEEQKLIQTKE